MAELADEMRSEHASVLPLADIRVLDLSWLLPGPFSTMLLAELGANVIKVERPGDGDYLRSLNPDMFEAVNRGKQSIVLDLKSADNAGEFQQLVAEADVVLESFRPGVADRLGIGPDALLRLKPSLVYVSLSGYGQTGPYASLPGHDVNYLAMAGALAVPGSWGKPSARSGLPVADLAGGMYAALNILAALRRRDSTGKGSRIDLSLAESVLHWTHIRSAEVGSFDAPRWHHVHPGNGVFPTRDGREISLALIEQKFYENFCRAAGSDELLARFPSVGTVAHDAVRGDAFEAALAGVVRERSLAEWTQTLLDADVPFAPVNLPAEVRVDRHFRARGILDATRPGTVVLPGGLGRVVYARAPRLGEHGAEILAATNSERRSEPVSGAL